MRWRCVRDYKHYTISSFFVWHVPHMPHPHVHADALLVDASVQQQDGGAGGVEEGVIRDHERRLCMRVYVSVRWTPALADGLYYDQKEKRVRELRSSPRGGGKSTGGRKRVQKGDELTPSSRRRL